jgi:hypothetical protein
MEPQAPITITMLPPVVWAILIAAISMVPFLLFLWWLNRRDRRRWAREDAERERQWALQQQVWEMERQTWDEQLSDEEREARRRLGLPDEEDPA